MVGQSVRRGYNTDVAKLTRRRHLGDLCHHFTISLFSNSSQNLDAISKFHPSHFSQNGVADILQAFLFWNSVSVFDRAGVNHFFSIFKFISN